MLPQNTKEQLQSMQRDVAQLQDQIRQLQKGQSDQVAALTALVQQSLDEVRKTNALAGGLQRSIDSKLTDLQTKLVGPVATVGSKVDQMADDFRSVQTNVAELTKSMRKMDEKLTDISTAVRTINTPVAPPTAAGSGAPPPAGMSAETSFQTAFRDYQGKKDELAMQEFVEYLKYFDKTANAPLAQFYIGQIYDRANQFDDAAQAFDAVLTRYPENDKTPEAMYMKGVSLLKGNHKTDAGQVFKDFIEKYPSHTLVPRAKDHLKGLGLSSGRSGTTQKKKGSKQ
jgi:TolA-binding protein